jgi:hypothetical protein
VRRGLLTPEPPPVFVPLQLIGEPPGAELAKYAKPSRPAGPDVGVADDKIEITLPDGTCIRIGHEVSLATLRQ